MGVFRFRPGLANLGQSARISTLVFVVCAIFALSILFRYENLFERPLLSHNEDATGHALFTMRAQMDNPAALHAFLPLITANQAGSRDVASFPPASVSDDNGFYYYVSFPPLSFAAPGLLLSALGAEPTLISLRLFSLGTGLVSVLALTLLLAQILPRRVGDGADDTFRLAVAGFGGLAYMLHPEALWSHGNIIWAHVLYQPILLVGCLALVRVLQAPHSRAARWTLGVLVTLGCLIDWSAYLFSIACFLVLGFRAVRARSRAHLLGAVAVAAGGLAGGIGVLLHWGVHLSLSEVLTTLAARPSFSHTITSTGTGAPVLAALYLGPLLLIGLGFLYLARRGARVADTAPDTPVWSDAALPVLFVLAFTTLESIIFLQHSTWYAYGMLKPILLVVVLLCLAAAALRAHPRRHRALGAGLAGLAVFGLGLYSVQNPASLRSSFFAQQYEEIEKVTELSSVDDIVFANLILFMGVELGRTQRNVLPATDLTAGNAQMTLQQAQAYLRDRSPAATGKFFVFSGSRDVEERIHVWWPTVKSSVVRRPIYMTGRLIAVITFDADSVREVMFTEHVAQDGSTICDMRASCPSRRPRPATIGSTASQNSD